MSKVRDFLGPYRLARLIRHGSVCQVWEAIESHTQKHYALKVLRPEKRKDKTELGFLRWEHSVAADFNHKNIIHIHDFVTNADTPFLVLELFSEMNLKMALRRGPEGIAHLVEKVMLQTAEALFYIHEKGYVHCDVKPDNILVNRDGEVRVIDFTIAVKKKTGLGRLFNFGAKQQGTRSYMSPEQIRKQTLDERADVYSLGCTFYEILTGKLPFTAPSPNELLSKHLSAPVPSALVHNSNITPEFNGVLRSMMAKEPADRPSSMWEVAKAIKGVKMFVRPPRLPESSIFDDIPMGGRVENLPQANDGAQKPSGEEKPEDEKPEDEKPGEAEQGGEDEQKGGDAKAG